MGRTIGTGMRLPGSLLGSAIRRVRMALGVSQAAFASAVGAKGHAMVANWEAGRAVPCALYLYGIATLARGTDRTMLLRVAGEQPDAVAVHMTASRMAAQGELGL